MSRFKETVWCDGCGVEIIAAPLVVDGKDYCCVDCYQGLQCDCQPEVELPDSLGTASGD